jgi:hypothetical protein
MTYICPINQRACRCDPEATDKRFHPCVLARRVSKIFRLMGSDLEGEANAAAHKLVSLIRTEGVNCNDLGTLIENCDGRIEERKYSDADAEMIYSKGVEQGIQKGRAEEARKQQAPPEFYDADGSPRWYEIALYCEQNSGQLRDEWDRNFISGMPEKMIRWKSPTAKQIPILMSIFKRLGGYYDAKAANLYR